MSFRNHGVSLAVVTVFLCGTFLANPVQAANELTLPLTAESIKTFLESQASPTVESFLTSLPTSMKQNFVLMHESQSMQRATPLQPRQIMFGSDARFLLAVSGIPEDPRYNELEFAEFEPATGRYHFGVISFAANAPATVTKDVGFCQNCHGAIPHPIWAQYPEWKGAYGDDTGAIDSDLRQEFASFFADASTTPHFQHLKFQSNSDHSKFLLSGRYYPYPNTDFNHELGNTVAIGTLTKLKSHPNYAMWSPAALATTSYLHCSQADSWFDLNKKINTAYGAIETRFSATTRPDVKVMRLLGVDPMVELSLEKMAGVPGLGGTWQTGAFKIQEAVAFQVLVDLIDHDSGLGKLFASEQETIASIKGHAELVGEPRAVALQKSSSWFLFFDVFDPVGKNASRRDAVCGYLASKIR